MSYIMHRTQLMLEDWQYERLRSLSETQGRGISEVVREILTSYLTAGADQVQSRLDAVTGIAEGPADLGREHDRYLYGDSEDS